MESIDSCGDSNHLTNSISNTSSSEESKTNLIVNYLPQTMTGNEFKAIFESIGNLESCKLIKNRQNNQSLCFGFINYSRMADAEQAIKTLNGLKIENKTIKVSYARPSSESIKGANLYICGIPKHWSTIDLNNYFNQCGRIITSRILFNTTNGLSKGIGFVRFDQRSEAELAIGKLNGRVPHGGNPNEPITVKYASPAESIAAMNLASPAPFAAATTANLGYFHHHQPPPQPPKITSSGHNNAAAIMRPLLPLTIFSETTQNLPPPTTGTGFFGIPTGVINNNNNNVPSQPTGWCIFVYNLAPETDEAVLWQLFGPFGAVLNVKVMRNFSNHKCKGFGFVTMLNYGEAAYAIVALNGVTLASRVLQVSFKQNKLE